MNNPTIINITQILVDFLNWRSMTFKDSELMKLSNFKDFFEQWYMIAYETATR